MTITQTAEIPIDRRVFFDLPPYLPLGMAKFELTITPEDASQKENVKPLSSLFGIHRELDTMEAYFARKRADKELEDRKFKQNLPKAP
jgi:hypothetical protein